MMSAEMQAAVLRKHATPPEYLQWSIPQRGKGQALVRVLAAPISQLDLLRASRRDRERSRRGARTVRDCRLDGAHLARSPPARGAGACPGGQWRGRTGGSTGGQAAWGWPCDCRLARQ